MGQLNAAHANMALSLVGAPPAGIQPGDKPSLKRSLHSSGVRPPQDMAFLHCSVGLAGSWCMPQIAPNPVGSALPAAWMGAIWNAGLEPQTCPRLTLRRRGATDARGGQEGGGSSDKSTSHHRLHQQQSPRPTAKSLRHQARRHDLHACLVCLLSPLRLWQLCPCHVLCSVPAALHLPYGCWIGLQPFFLHNMNRIQNMYQYAHIFFKKKKYIYILYL